MARMLLVAAALAPVAASNNASNVSLGDCCGCCGEENTVVESTSVDDLGDSTGWWTAWSNSNTAGSRRDGAVCPGDLTVKQVILKEQGCYGIIDVRLLCNDWNYPPPNGGSMTGNPNGGWNQVMGTGSTFSSIQFREQGCFGIINGRVFQGDSSETSNSNMNGGWNTELSCGTGGALAGLQVREQSGYGIVNARAYCKKMDLSWSATTVCFQALYAFEGGSQGWYEKTVESTVGRKSSEYHEEKTYVELQTSISASMGGLFWSADASLNTDFQHSSETCISNFLSEETKTTETFHIDLSKPAYIYQSSSDTILSDGSSMSSRGVIQQFTSPVDTICHTLYNNDAAQLKAYVI